MNTYPGGVGGGEEGEAHVGLLALFLGGMARESGLALAESDLPDIGVSGNLAASPSNLVELIARSPPLLFFAPLLARTPCEALGCA